MSTDVILVGGVGYTFLGDLSFGAILVERLRRLPWPSSVAIEDVSYNPITVMDWLRDVPDRFDRAVLISAVERGDEPGHLRRSRWTATAHSTAEVQACVAEAVTGSIGLDNLLVIGTHFGLLPKDTTVIELEPVDSGWGEGLSPVAEQRAAELESWLVAEFGELASVSPASAVEIG